MMFYLLPAEIRDALIQYLSTRPLGEVLNGYEALLALQKVEASEEEK